MLSNKMLFSCILVSCILNISLGIMDFSNFNSEQYDTSDEPSYLSFEKFLEKSNLINHLRKNLENEINYLEQIISHSNENHESQKILSKIKTNYNLLDKDLDSFIPNQELLEQLIFEIYLFYINFFILFLFFFKQN
jgi:hypothetical protein